MENYQTAYGLNPDRDLPPTPTSYNSLPIREQERQTIDTGKPSQTESNANNNWLPSGGLFNSGAGNPAEKKAAKERLKAKVREKRERLKSQKNVSVGNELPPAWYDLSTSSSLTPESLRERGHHHGGHESVKTTWSQKHRKKVRVVCISDTHNQTPARLPQGDILIHAGDLTNSGTYKELSRAAEWLKGLRGYEYKIVIPGNHDLALDRTWVEDFGYEIGVGIDEDDCVREGRRTWEECVELFWGEEARSRGIVYLGPAPGDYEHVERRGGRDSIESEDGGGSEKEEEEVKIPGKMEQLRLSNGVKFTVWGCPAIPRIMRPDLSEREVLARGGTSINSKIGIKKPKRQWAFGYSTPTSLEESCWANIPTSGIDILITHTPPKYHLDCHDESSLSTTGATSNSLLTAHAGLERAKFLGCEFLRRALWRTRPKLHVFGHLHEGRGAQVVRWDTESKWVRWREGRVVEWVEPGGGKMSLVDLTGSSSKGESGKWKVVVDEGKGVGGGGGNVSTKATTLASGEIWRDTPDDWPNWNIPPNARSFISEASPRHPPRSQQHQLGQHTLAPPLPSHTPDHSYHPPRTPHPADTLSSIATMTPPPALLPGQETCLVNASYVRSSFYTRGAAHAAAAAAAGARKEASVGGSRRGKGGVPANLVNKPMVVDLELEVEAGWLEEQERLDMEREKLEAGRNRGRDGGEGVYRRGGMPEFL